jgi:hypothetical protein
MGWNQVRWTEAHQIASLIGVDADDAPAEGVSPEEHYRALREAGDFGGAVTFLGVALPRLEALAWAGRVLEDDAAGRELKHADRQALDHALRWLGDPSEHARRASRDAAEAADERSPERLLALGVFFSGGTIADPEFQPVPPAPEVAGKLAAAAIVVAATRDPKTAQASLERALALGERVAADGIGALEAA